MPNLDERSAPLPFKYNILEQGAAKLPEGVLMKIGGVFQRAEQKNANGRVYPRQLWTEVLSRPDIQERIQERRMFGMLGHPADGVTDPEKVALIVTKQELRSDDAVYGEAEVLDTPQGRIAATLLKAGAGIGISSRGDGSIEKKGDVQEVQTDYRLETYDLVLKPSTPGAYPGMLSESTVEENEKLVAEAIEGLVNSEIPTDQRVGVLTECLKILSVLEAENSGDRVKTISSKITEELRPKPLITVQANESSAIPGFNPLQTQGTEGNMPYQNPAQNPSAPQLSGDTLAWHQHQVSSAVQQAVQAKEQEISQLKDTVIKGQREHTETKKRLKAAESLIEDFTKKIKDLEESGPADAALQERYQAAVALLDEALKRLPEVGQLGRRCETLESLLQASFDHVFEDRLSGAVSEHLSQIDPAYHDHVRPILENCTSPEAVASTFKALVSISGNAAPRRENKEPLPSPRDRSINENQNPQHQPQSAPRKTLVSMLGNRLSKAV